MLTKYWVLHWSHTVHCLSCPFHAYSAFILKNVNYILKMWFKRLKVKLNSLTTRLTVGIPSFFLTERKTNVFETHQAMFLSVCIHTHNICNSKQPENVTPALMRWFRGRSVKRWLWDQVNQVLCLTYGHAHVIENVGEDSTLWLDTVCEKCSINKTELTWLKT